MSWMAEGWLRYLNSKLLTLYFAGFVGPLSANTVLALIPILKSTFNVDVGTVLLSITVLMLPFAFFQLFSGPLSDMYGRRNILVLGFLIYGTGLLVIGFSPNFNIWVFLGARFVCGVGYAFIGPVLPAAIGDLTEISYRGKVMGIYSSVATLAVALGPLLAGFFAYSWWYVYFMLSGMAYTSMLLIWFILGKIIEPRKADVQVVSQVANDLKDACSMGGVMALSAAGFLGFLSFMGVQSFLSDALSLHPYYMQPDAIGLILSVGGAVGIFVSPAAGHLADKLGRGKVAYLGVALSFASLILLLISRDFPSFMLSMALFGVGRNLFWLPLVALSVELSPKQRGATSSVFNSIRFFGYAIAPYLLTPVYEGWLLTGFSSGLNAVTIVSLLLLLVTIPLIRYVAGQKLPELMVETAGVLEA
ncbi:MAG: MFS transporter [Candidatus Freyarchaeota archaeon]